MKRNNNSTFFLLMLLASIGFFPACDSFTDFGNTNVKFAFFEKGELSSVKRYGSDKELFDYWSFDLPVVVSAVRNKLL